MADGTRVVEPLNWDGYDQTNTRITTIDTVDIDFGNGDMRERQRIIVVAGSARTVWNEALSVVPGTTSTVVTLVGEAKLRVLGFSATGTGDARFRLLIDDQVVVGAPINVTNPEVQRALLVGMLVPAGQTATIEVMCRGTQPCDYEATIYAEVSDG